MNTLLEKVNVKMNRAGFMLKKKSPEILIVLGGVGIVTSTVLACRATLKLNDILDESKKTIDTIHKYRDEDLLEGKYTEEDSRKDLLKTYGKTGIQLIKLYAPSVFLGTMSITCMVASNNILRKRNISLAAAYATLDKGYKEYRDRVRDRFGEEAERDIRFNTKVMEFEETEIDAKGKEKKVKKEVKVVGEPSEYAKFFDECSRYWEKNADYNLMFLRKIERYANDQLCVRGHLFLNEVYDMLDIERTVAGQTIGWIYDVDSKIDFGIYDCYSESKRKFVNGYERNILLDFNVDGDILSMI